MNGEWHAKLSPSGWKQWGTCSGSMNLINSLGIGDKSSTYAAEGSVAHEIHKRCLLKETDAKDYIGESITIDGFTFTVTDEMAEAVQISIDYIKRRIFEAVSDDYTVKIIVEERVSLEHLDIPGLDGGTADVIIIFIDNFTEEVHEIEVVDYKHGAGVYVDVVENGQALQYALGATALPEINCDHLELIRITISQPRYFASTAPVRSWTITYEELKIWEASELIPRAKATLPADAPLVPSEDACRFCKASGFSKELDRTYCPQLSILTTETAMMDFADIPPVSAAGLTTEQKIRIYKNEKLIASFFKAVTKSIFNEMLSGATEYSDFLKIVRGKSNRKLSDNWVTESAKRIPKKDLYVKKEIGLGDLEKKLGKTFTNKEELFEFMKTITFKPKGDLTLAPIDDKREAVTLTKAEDEDW